MAEKDDKVIGKCSGLLTKACIRCRVGFSEDGCQYRKCKTWRAIKALEEILEEE